MANKIKRLESFLKGAVRFIFSPIFFLTLFAPSCITHAIDYIHGQLAKNLISTKPNELLTFMANKLLPGVVDYVLQYYTAMLAFVFWFVTFFVVVVIPSIPSLVRSNPESIGTGTQIPNLPRTTVSSLAFLIVGGLASAAIIHVFLFEAANEQLINVYVAANPEIGKWHLPPMNSPITWVRVSVGLLYLLLYLLKNRK